MTISKPLKTGIIVVLAFIGLAVFSRLTKAKPNEANKTENPNIEKNIVDTSIKGLMPVDIYLNLEKKGYAITKNHSLEYGDLINCKNSSAGIDYVVDISGNNENPVEEVRATATINGTEPTKLIIATKPFIKYISSVQYEGSEANKVAEWIEKNFDNDKSTIEVSKVKFTISAPTKFVRILSIQKNN
ncbi:hypothetical protein [Flavobacterium psychrophilum]|uniref:hypothetical protein n=1 Tax=Flavobacterium psychrophilum TaxID=96345 RepID=UPI000B7C1D58|nr:hypothetical protein [Flavobacterium psychrophilum]EKT3967142.1 hypothetical protein [Flavobacterium psychrophilum]MBF2024357.1 hypothetical protein [Flavobacterium psychrophilum]MCB5983191.1 hypothetical protein [Flavobacterium psychrophilum]MCB5995437.1 hypothetical protein [Flavobacterium psychrophilum]MCB5997775.1 hypothetical protein [Flavobacterium psychrophilum]